MKPLSLLVVLLAGCPLPCVAQTEAGAASVRPLTLEACLEEAAARHPAIAAARSGVDAARASVGEASAPLYPQLDANAGFHRFQRRAFLPSGLVLPGREAPALIGPLGDWTGGLSSRVTLFDFGERRAGVTAAEARHGGALSEAEAVRAEVRLAVKNAFFSLAAAQELRAVAEKNLERAESHHRLAQVRRRAGAVPLADELRTEAEQATARLQLASSRSRVVIASGTLNAAMGRPPETPLSVVLPSVVAPPPETEGLGPSIQRALANRPELRAAVRRADAARASLGAARAARAPKVRADAAFGWNDTTWLPETREWQAGLSIDVPLFDAGARSQRVARSKAELSREEAVLEQRRLQIRQEVWSAHAERERAWTAIGLSEAAVRAGAESLRVVKERYEGGAAVVTDLLDTQMALARSEAALAEARWTYLAACAVFERAVGGANATVH